MVREEEPFNAETGLLALADGPLTATDAFYVRGHAAVPHIAAAGWRLHVGGLVDRELDLSLATLREALPERDVTATLQCAGNRRAGLIAVRDIPGEAPWGPGATGTARWVGVALSDVLALAGSLREAAHVAFVGADVCAEAKPPKEKPAACQGLAPRAIRFTGMGTQLRRRRRPAPRSNRRILTSTFSALLSASSRRPFSGEGSARREPYGRGSS